jgi:uncharacterized protein (DUF1499 family)
MSIRTLAPCPSSPNCVSTQAQDEGHAITPIRYRKSRAEAKEALKEIVRSLSRTKLVEEDESFRSASRTGYGDLGVNRSRMEQVRGLAGEKL